MAHTPSTLRDVASAGLDQTNSVYFKGNVNGLIWYTTAQLEQLGLQPPQTWEEFTAAMDQATAAGIQPLVVGGKDSWPLTQSADPVILGVAGPEKFAALARGEIGWDDPDIVAAFETYADVARNYFPENTLDIGFIDETCGRALGDYMFQNQGAFISLITPAKCDRIAGCGRGLHLLQDAPAGRISKPAQAVSGGLILRGSTPTTRRPPRALLEYLGSADAQSIWAERGGYIAPNADVAPEVYPTDIDRQAAELWPTDPSVAAGYDLDDWIGGEIQSTYTQALQQLVREYDVGAFIDTMTQVDTRSRWADADVVGREPQTPQAPVNEAGGPNQKAGAAGPRAPAARKPLGALSVHRAAPGGFCRLLSVAGAAEPRVQLF